MKRVMPILAAMSLMLAATSCVDTTGDDRGLDMRSRGTGERNQRLGNDPAQQNTGEGSTTGDGPTSQEEPQNSPQE